MKTKDLIMFLIQADPTGECECVVSGKDIFSIEKEPGYYDGPYEILLRDSDSRNYNVVGAIHTTANYKVRIRTHSIEDAIYENPDLPVRIEYGYSDETRTNYLKENIEKIRKQARNVISEVEESYKITLKGHFQEYVKNPTVETLDTYFGKAITKGRRSVYKFLEEKAETNLDSQILNWLEYTWDSKTFGDVD